MGGEGHSRYLLGKSPCPLPPLIPIGPFLQSSTASTTSTTSATYTMSAFLTPCYPAYLRAELGSGNELPRILWLSVMMVRLT